MFEDIHRALRALSGVCDGAQSQDGTGFNGCDTRYGKWLARIPELSHKHATKAYFMLKKYHKQLLQHGIDYYKLVEPKQEQIPNADYLIAYLSQFPIEYFNRIKQNCHFTNDISQKHWEIYKTHKDELKELGVGCTKYCGQWFFYLISTTFTEEDEIVEEVFTEVKETPKIAEETIDSYLESSNLYDYQKPHVKKIIQSIAENKISADSSDTGTGKTFSNLNAAKFLIEQGLYESIFIVCPKAVIPSWKRSIETLGIKNWAIANYELAIRGKQIKFKTKKNGSLSYSSEKSQYIYVATNPEAGKKFQPKKIMQYLKEDFILIFDEAHRGKNRNTQNSQMMIQASTQKITTMMLSATLGEDPLKMFGTGALLKLWNTEAPWTFYTEFASKYGAYKRSTRYATFWTSNTTTKDMERMRKEIGNKMTGMRTTELRAKGLFPETQILAENYYINGSTAKIAKEYENLALSLAEIDQKKSEIENGSMNESAARLAIMQKTMQSVELLKVPTIVELATDFYESGNSTVIFCNYTDSLMQTKALIEKATKEKVGLIYGGQNASQNEQNRQDFQDNKIKFLICNIQAAREGIDLHDVHQSHPRVSLINPTWSAQNLKQVLGRIDRAGGSASIQRIVFAADTPETKICEALTHKLNNIETLNDQDLTVF